MTAPDKQFGSVVILNSAGQILLVKESKPQVFGKLNLPGGHVEEGETPLQCAIREALEETGLHVHPRWMLGAYQFHAGTNLVYLAERADAVPPSAAELRWGWYSLEAIRQMPDAAILNPPRLRAVLNDLALCRQRPL